MQNRPNNAAASQPGAIDIDRLLYVLNRVVPVRHRHILTRRGTVRLRFLALPGGGLATLALLIGAALSPGLDGSSSGAIYQHSTPMQVATAARPEPAVVLTSAAASVLASDDSEQALSGRLSASQKRLRRSSEELDQAERIAMIEPAAGIGQDRLQDDVVPAPVSTSTTVSATAQEDQAQERTIKIGSGDTLTGVLSRAGLNHNEAYHVAQAFRKHVDPRSLRPGQVLNIRFDPNEENGGGYRFAALNMALDSLRTLSVARGEAEGGYSADLHEKQVHRNLYLQETEVETSLFGSAARAGIPKAIVAEAIRIYSWDIDFQRDLRQGDRLQVLYEQFETEDGDRVKTGNILYARLNIGGRDVPIYRYEMKDGRVDYFQSNGRSIRKALMSTPVDGARMSSGYGMRRHPIQGYNRMHKGIDFAAPTGTPIYAAGDGVIERIGRNGGYGNYIRIRHNSQLHTAYAHMSRFASGMGSGKRVRQGEVIGYVGSTGNSTGPHLHYEVLVNGAHVNPRGMNLPTGEILEGEHLRLFQAHARQVDRDLNSRRSIKTAQSSSAAAAAGDRRTAGGALN